MVINNPDGVLGTDLDMQDFKNTHAMNKFIPLAFCLTMTISHVHSQDRVAIKTNLLYTATTYAPNLGLEIGLGRHTTLDLSGGYNWFKSNDSRDHKKLVHFIVQPEFRYFLCERFYGHFFGVHALYSRYNISGHELPMLFGKGSSDYRLRGQAWGGGVSYGYQFLLGKNWNLELELGVGYARLVYDKYDCRHCGRHAGSAHRDYFGPTKAAVSLIYIIK